MSRVLRYPPIPPPLPLPVDPVFAPPLTFHAGDLDDLDFEEEAVPFEEEEDGMAQISRSVANAILQGSGSTILTCLIGSSHIEAESIFEFAAVRPVKDPIVVGSTLSVDAFSTNVASRLLERFLFAGFRTLRSVSGIGRLMIRNSK